MSADVHVQLTRPIGRVELAQEIVLMQNRKHGAMPSEVYVAPDAYEVLERDFAPLHRVSTEYLTVLDAKIYPDSKLKGREARMCFASLSESN